MSPLYYIVSDGDRAMHFVTRDEDGVLFTLDGARAFAAQRNARLVTPTYQVHPVGHAV